MSFELDAFSLIFESESSDGACSVDEEQLGRVTSNHVLAFFQSQDSFLNMTLNPEVLLLNDDSVFACQDDTEISLQATVTYAVVSRGTPAQIQRELLRYLHQTRNSFAAFLRELGWKDLETVSVKSYTGDDDDDFVPTAPEEPKEGWKETTLEDSLFWIIVIAAACLVIIAVLLIIVVCRKRGCCGGGSLERERRNGGVQSTADRQLDGATRSITPRAKIEGQNDANRPSSAVGTLSGSSEDENSVPLSREQKSRGNTLIESTVTVGTQDMSSVSLSRVLGSQHSVQSSDGSTSTDRHIDPGTTSRGRLPVKDSDQAPRRETAISPQSDCRGLMKTPTIYRYLEAKLSTTSKHSPKETDTEDPGYLRKLAELKLASRDSTPSPPKRKHPRAKSSSKSVGSAAASRASAASAIPALSLTSTKDDDDSEVNPIKSAIGRFVNSTKESKEVAAVETRSYASSFVPNFMMSFGSTLSVATNGESSVSSKSANSSVQQEIAISGVERVESLTSQHTEPDTHSKAPSVTNSEATVKSKGGSLHRRYSFAQKEQLVKEDLRPIIASSNNKNQSDSELPRTNSFQHSPRRFPSDTSLGEKRTSVDPVFSSVNVLLATSDDGNSSSNRESVDEEATDYSPPERTYFFTE